MKVVFLGALAPAEQTAWRSALRAAGPAITWLTPEQARPDPAQVDAAVVARPAPGALAEWPRLRLIQCLWAGVDALFADATVPAEVPLARLVDPSMSAAMAETALWATLACARGFFRYARQQGRHEWRQLPQRRADQVRVGVLGLGAMGLAAARCIAAQGFDVAGWSLQPRALPVGLRGFFGAEALPALLARSDVLINLLPLTPATRGLLDRRAFAALPRNACVVNLARGAHVVDADLLAALDGGQLRHAVLDVFHTEPLPPEHPFWQHPSISVLPHVAAATDPATAAPLAVANLRALDEGRPLVHLVDRARGY